MSKYRGNLVSIAEDVRAHGRGGDDILVHVNPDEFKQMQQAWGEHSVNPHTGLPEYGLFSKLKKALKFEVFNTKKIVKDVLKNPQRLLTGAVDPLGTKITNKMFGTNYDPIVNQLGGATEKRFRDAEAQGIDTGLARDLHKVAGLVAGFYGAQGLGKLANAGLGNLGQSAGAIGNAAGTTAEGIAPIDTSIISQAGIPSSVTSGLGEIANTGSTLAADGIMPLADTSILNAGIPSSVTNGIQAASPGLGQSALNYAKDFKNWPTIAKGVTALGGIVGGAGGAGGPPPPPAEDPGYTVDPQYLGRNFSAGDYSKYYNYGEGPEHSYYTYGPQPTEVWSGDDPSREEGLARGGQPRVHYSGLGAPLSNTPRYMQDGPGSGRGDEIDAKLSPKEYVMDAETVALLGDGNPDFGAKKLDEMRRKIRMHKGKSLAKGKFSKSAKDPEGYL